MVRTPPSPPTMRPEPFNPDAEYPPFDKNATEDIDGKKIKLLASPLDTAYLYDVPEKMINLTFQMKMTNQKTTNNKTKQIHGVEMLNHTLSPESVDKTHHS